MDGLDKIDALALLQADHADIYEGFYKFFDAMPRSEQLGSEVLQALEVHAQMEMDAFYPELDDDAASAEALTKARDDHAAIQAQIDAVRKQLPRGTDVDDLMWTLLAKARDHFSEEERTLFPAARARLGAALWDIALALQARKAEAAGAGGVG